MLIACWSAKGGSGTTVVACALALVLAERSRVVLADLAGDIPAVLARAEPDTPGLADWIAAGPGVGQESLARLEVEGAPGLRLLTRGRAPVPADAGGDGLAAALAAYGDPVVVDCGVIGSTPSPAHSVAAAAGVSLLVIRPCYLALRRAVSVPLRPSGAVVVVEPKRALHAADVEAALDVPVKAEVPFLPVISRAVDAGLLAHRVPPGLRAPLRRAVR